MPKFIDLKYGNMRKPQNFIIYPTKATDTQVTVQSDKRIAQIDIATGKGILSAQQQNGAYSPHLLPALGATYIQVTPEDLEKLKGLITATPAKEIIGGIMIVENQKPRVLA